MTITSDEFFDRVAASVKHPYGDIVKNTQEFYNEARPISAKQQAWFQKNHMAKRLSGEIDEDLAAALGFVRLTIVESTVPFGAELAQATAAWEANRAYQFTQSTLKAALSHTPPTHTNESLLRIVVMEIGVCCARIIDRLDGR